MNEFKYTKNRFKESSISLHQVRREVYELENWLGVHPFPKQKHGAKYINDLTN